MKEKIKKLKLQYYLAYMKLTKMSSIYIRQSKDFLYNKLLHKKGMIILKIIFLNLSDWSSLFIFYRCFSVS